MRLGEPLRAKEEAYDGKIFFSFFMHSRPALASCVLPLLARAAPVAETNFFDFDGSAFSISSSALFNAVSPSMTIAEKPSMTIADGAEHVARPRRRAHIAQEGVRST